MAPAPRRQRWITARRVDLAGLLGAGVGFGALLDSVREGEHVARWDPDVLGWIVEHRVGFATSVMR